MDPPTIAFCIGVVAATLALLMALASGSLPEEFAAPSRQLCLGMVCYGCTSFLLATGDALPLWYGAIVGNGLLGASFVLFGVALHRFNGLPVRGIAWFGAVLTVVSVLQHAYFLQRGDTVNARLFLGSLCQVALGGVVVALPWRIPAQRRNLGLWLISAGFAVFGTLLLYRALLFAFGPAMGSVLDLPTLQVASYVSALLLPLLAGVGTLQTYAQWIQDDFKRAASIDALTGCLNRGALERRVVEILSANARHGRPLALLVFDLDDLKRINDSQGHQMGDRVLAALAAELGALLGPDDVLGRMGGDEFVVLLENTGLAEAHGFQARLRARIDASSDPATRQVSVSVGVATLRPGDDFDALLKRADLAMYARKQAGRTTDPRLPALQ